MVSFAVAGGGVGPHYDRYDVFLLQGHGQREWRLGGLCDDNTPLLDHEHLQLMEPFQPTDTFILEPGDALYVPPQIAHWGIALDDCITYSIGFRAANLADLMARRVDGVLDQLLPTLLLEDRHSVIGIARPGEITAEHMRNAKAAIDHATQQLDEFLWLGELVTEIPDIAEPRANALTGAQVSLSNNARMAWMQRTRDLCIFVNGDSCPADAGALDLIVALCAGQAVALSALQQADRNVAEFLMDQNALISKE